MPYPPHPLARVGAAIDIFSEWTGRIIAWLTLLMVITTFVIVVLRYGYNTGYIWMQESVLYMNAVVFLVGAGYTLKRDGHVRVDVFYREMSPKGKAICNLIGTLIFLLPVSIFILTISWEYVATSWGQNEVSREPGGIPYVYLLKSTILAMGVVVLLQGIADLIRSSLTIAGHRYEAE